MPSLVEIAKEVNAIEEMLLENGGEMNAHMEAYLANVHVALKEKVDGYSVVMAKLHAVSHHYKEQAEKFANAAKTITNFTERLEHNIKVAMQRMGVSEVKGTDIKFKLSPTKGRIVVNDLMKLPPACVIEKREMVADKEAIRQKLEKGELVEGVIFEQTYSLRTYINKGE